MMGVTCDTNKEEPQVMTTEITDHENEDLHLKQSGALQMHNKAMK